MPSEILPNPTWLNIRNQKQEGACTGFALAAVIDLLLRQEGDTTPVSSRMLYEEAKRNDAFPDDQGMEGSSARGAIKGWYRNGVCAEHYWPYKARQINPPKKGAYLDALKRPLGAYYRIEHNRSDLHAALLETGAVMVTARVHKGWDQTHQGTIDYDATCECVGHHAFALVGYTDTGFLVQNSYGKKWGGLKIGSTHLPGVAIWQYEDFEHNYTDGWVVRRARPVEQANYLRPAVNRRHQQTTESRILAPPRTAIAQHYIHIDDGQFDDRGTYRTTPEEAKAAVKQALKAQHILLFAHGGLNSVKGSAKRVAQWRSKMGQNGVYDLHFIWETGLIAELFDLLGGKKQQAQERAGFLADWSWDAWVERISKPLGYPVWQEMLTDAEDAFKNQGAGTQTLKWLFQGYQALPANQRPKLHLAGHSAGGVWHAQLLKRWQTLQGPPIESLTLMAPACRRKTFDTVYAPLLHQGLLKKLELLILNDQQEQDDHVAKVYQKSLLYLVSHAFMNKRKKVTLLGMEKDIEDLIHQPPQRMRIHPSPSKYTTATQHGQFDNDAPSMNHLLQTILGQKPRHPFTPHDLKGY
ncbi:C1 family peptidase [Magnetococcus sp. PR-3]|uniref:C1 family peptidase n=1 Tax=Magnetococcus sp. PR-3 TaxID=3120355 RepID=UPI002FCE6539